MAIADYQPAERIGPDGKPYWPRSAQILVDKMKPSHTEGFIIESINMLYEDPYSLCDRDLLGA